MGIPAPCFQLTSSKLTLSCHRVKSPNMRRFDKPARTSTISQSDGLLHLNSVFFGSFNHPPVFGVNGILNCFVFPSKSMSASLKNFTNRTPLPWSQVAQSKMTNCKFPSLFKLDLEKSPL